MRGGRLRKADFPVGGAGSMTGLVAGRKVCRDWHGTRAGYGSSRWAPAWLHSICRKDAPFLREGEKSVDQTG